MKRNAEHRSTTGKDVGGERGGERAVQIYLPLKGARRRTGTNKSTTCKERAREKGGCSLSRKKRPPPGSEEKARFLTNKKLGRGKKIQG